MYLSYWVTAESRKVPSPLMQPGQSNENISDAIPIADPKEKTEPISLKNLKSKQ